MVVLLLVLHFAGGLYLTGLLNLSYGNIILVLQSTVHITLALFFFLVKHVWYDTMMCVSFFPLVLILLTLTCWKSNKTNARLVTFALSLALDPTSGIHSHWTLRTAHTFHLLKPNLKPPSSHRVFAPTNVNTQFLLQSFVFACYNTSCELFW